jgi:hypothetical protein
MLKSKIISFFVAAATDPNDHPLPQQKQNGELP